MNVREEIEALVDIEGRAPGSDAERRAAEHLVARLEQLGRGANTEAVDVWPNWPATYALHATLAIAGSVVSVSIPILGAALVLLATVLTFLDANGMALTTRRLLGKRASQNVISRERNDNGGILVLVAHYDAGRGGLAFNRKLHERRASISKTLKRPIGPLQPLFYALVFVLVFTLLRLVGLDNMLLTVFQFLGTVVLILALPFLIDTALADAVPGANDNASGVATVLRLAERYGGELEYFDVHVLFTGSEEAFALGMRSFIKRHKQDLNPERVVFLNVEEVGAGTVRFTTKEGLLAPLASHTQLVKFCKEIVEAREESEREDEDDDDDGQPDELKEEEDDDDEDSAERVGVRGFVSRTVSDGYAARSAGFPAVTITCKGRLDYTASHHQMSDTADRIDDEALERAYEFCCDLIEKLDQTVGPDLEKPVEGTMLKEEDGD